MDLFHLPDESRRQQVFGYTGDIQTWVKPRGITMLHMFAVSSGGGGGPGFSAGGATQAGGGSGGAAGPTGSLVIPAAFLPETLYVFAAPGGAGGAPGGPGSAGTASWVGVDTGVNVATRVLASGNSGSAIQGGNSGTATAGGGVASTGSTAQVTSCLLAVAGVMSVTAGVGSAAGSAAGAGAGFNVLTLGSLTIPGGPGAGTTGSANFAGGGFTGTANIPWFTASQPGGTAGGGRGDGGYSLRVPMVFTEGFGGGSNFSGTGGAGGAGSTGCGGGGGGGGATGGPGGNGGNGLVIITGW